MKPNKKSVIEHDIATAKNELNEKVKTFTNLRTTAETHSTDATKAMLEQAKLVADIATRYKGNKFDNAVSTFRANTGLESGSKWSQFKRIGSVADELLAVADRLPSGWSSLYAIASALTNKKHHVSLEDLLDATLVREKRNTPETITLNAYSTQSEVRSLVASAGGRVPAERVPAAPAYFPEFRIALDRINSETFDADLTALENALAQVTRKFPWVSFEHGQLNALAKKQVAMRQQETTTQAA